MLDDLKAKLAAVEEELASEKKDREKVSKKYETQLREAEGKTEDLEEQLERTKDRLKGTKAELKDAQAELKKCQSELEAAREVSRNVAEKPGKSASTKAIPARKRRVQELSIDDMSIGTPGPAEAAIKRPLKKRGAEHALLGEKSTFSVTPFLSRTKDVSDDSINIPSPTAPTSAAPAPEVREAEEEPESAPVQEEEQASEAASEEPPSETEKPAPPKAKKARGRPKATATVNATDSETDVPASTKKRTAKPKKASALEPVSEEPDASEAGDVAPLKAKKSVEPKSKASTAGALDGEVKKKRRKLGGGPSKTLFDDEEDGEAAARPAKPQLAPGRKMKAHLGARVNAFSGEAGFSPLKKQRRGVGASFLVQ